MAPLELAPAVFDRGLIRGGVPASTFLAMATVVFLASGEDLGASARDVGDAGVSFPFLEGAVEGRRGGDAVPETPMTPSPPLPFFIPALIPRRADHSANETDASAAAGWAVEAVEVVAEAGLACNLARVGVMDVTRAGIATVFTGGGVRSPTSCSEVGGSSPSNLLRHRNHLQSYRHVIERQPHVCRHQSNAR